MATRSLSTPSVAVHYSVDASDVQAHLYRVTLTLAKPSKNQRFSLPVWIPGSYMVREFSKHLQNLVALQNAKPVVLEQLDKCTWQAVNTAAQPLVLTYAVYAYDSSVRAAFLDAQRGFFNPTSLCLRADGHTQRAHHLQLLAIKNRANYAVSTPANVLKVDQKIGATYIFSDYDELADTPFALGTFWRGSFTVRGVPHEFTVAGAPPSFDGKRLLQDTQKIVEAEMALWHGEAEKSAKSAKFVKSVTPASRPPFASYVFMLNAVDEGYGGLEHASSTALICNRRDLPRLHTSKQAEGYTTLLGLISHEYFHAWNVKRLRPAELARYDYGQEQYTQLLWFFEGFTSYYDDLLLRRAGLIDNASYLRLLNKTINQVMQTPGARVQSVAQSSFDAWVKYYRQDENTPNATVSYYTKGALVAACFDLTLRQRAPGVTLDAVMRGLWQRCKAGPMTQADFAAVLHTVSGIDFAVEIASWVHGTADLPLKALLEQQGVAVALEPPQLAQRLGLRVAEANGTLLTKVVLRGGAAELAGLCPGDEWLAVGTARGGMWRISKLDDLALYAAQPRAAKTKMQVLVSRDKRLHTLALTLPIGDATWVLRVADAERVNAWLAG